MARIDGSEMYFPWLWADRCYVDYVSGSQGEDDTEVPLPDLCREKEYWTIEESEGSMKLATRTKTVLHNFNYEKTRSYDFPSKEFIASFESSELCKQPECGKITLREIVIWLAEDGLCFKDYLPEKEKPVWDIVIADMKARDHLGRQRYKRALTINNGRDALQDAYEEALDLAVYLKQAILEREKGEEK